MILTVSLNPAIDKTYVVPRFDPAGINRVQDVSAVAGGKANNVARVLRVLGHPVRATGFLAGDTGRWIERALTAEGVQPLFYPIAGETRICIALIDPVGSRVAEIREPGPSVPADDQHAFLEQLPSLAQGCRVAVVSGSLPLGVQPSYLAEVVSSLCAAGTRVLVDTSGAALDAAVAAQPYLIKPNHEELAALVGRPASVDEASRMAREVAAARGVNIVVSLGAGGAVAATPNGQMLRARAPQVQAVNTVGAGDSLVAGLAAALAAGEDLAEALRLGVACGTASVFSEGVAVVTPERVARILVDTVMEA